ncbi:helix-turn-helix domain-containing protein [Breoghania sp.]|uniref:helix-turn-helix domain-containing protein n=1 Tax=Breoghania sp. TaxID=2065378 RepID=UPI002AA9546B|nr:helix-turn-helix domain-containing protein [Breoghania sp.]
MTQTQAIPQFHLFGEAHDDSAFDFIHVETLASRSVRHGWSIALHSHRHLNHILVIRSGTGTIRIEDRETAFRGPAVLCMPATVVHGFEFEKSIDGHITTFSGDVIAASGDASAPLRERLALLFADPVLLLSYGAAFDAICGHVDALADELTLARDGHQLAMHARLSLLIVEVARARASDPRQHFTASSFMDETITALRDLIEDNFREMRKITEYSDRLGMTAERLNEHCKRITGVTVGHLIRQRLVVEAKRQLLFTEKPISQIAYDLVFADPAHFSRFFRTQTGMSPQEFRKGRQA